jgi:2-keto-3-deoxy-L-rhamnonate aldolase RhmA
MVGLSEAILQNTQGVRITLRDPAVCRILQPFVDFFVIDPVAHALSPEMVQTMISVAEPKPVLIRTEDCHPTTLQKYLSWGADGLIISQIMHAADAEKAMAACLYPPEGLRPYRTQYAAQEISLGVINDQLTFLIEVAHPKTVEDIDAIIEVTGLDGVLVVPYALSVAMELDGRLDHPTLDLALSKVFKATDSLDMPCGLEDVVSQAYRAHFHVLTSDKALLQKAAGQVLGNPEDHEEGDLRALR